MESADYMKFANVWRNLCAQQIQYSLVDKPTQYWMHNEKKRHCKLNAQWTDGGNILDIMLQEDKFILIWNGNCLSKDNVQQC
jgi:hypothetical protein